MTATLPPLVTTDEVELMLAEVHQAAARSGRTPAAVVASEIGVTAGFMALASGRGDAAQVATHRHRIDVLLAVGKRVSGDAP